MVLKFVKNRIGDVVDFDISRIKKAIHKAYLATNELDVSDLDDIVNAILDDLDRQQQELSETDILSVEDIQNTVENFLMKYEKYDIAKEYIIYRNKHNEVRQAKQEEKEKKLEEHKLMVTKCDGTKESFEMGKIKQTYHKIAGEYEKDCPFGQLENYIKKYLIDGIKTDKLIGLIIKSAINLISIENTKWQYIAGRFAMSDLYKKASKNREIELASIYSGEGYLDLFSTYIEEGLYHKDFWNYYSKEDILKAGDYLDNRRDMEYNYTTTLMFKKRYLLNPNQYIRELPQEMYMSAALFLAMPESKEKRLDVALKIYDYTSTQKISLPTPTLMNARTNFCQLSSCFKLNLDDDLRSIYHNIENMAQISKFGGGIGSYLGNIRSKGGSIRGVKGASGGVMPWIKVINDTAIAVNQLGARAGAISVTLDAWHRDIHDFFDLQTERGDIRRKSYDIFPSISIPDLFMERVLEGGVWTLFDPKEIEDKYGKKLQDCFGDEFKKFYIKLENDNELKLKDTLHAKELFKEFLKTAVETGMPYVFFRDTVNKVNPNKHSGSIYSTQLCTEIAQNTSPSKFVEEVEEDGTVSIKYKAGDTVVCNLASINVAKVNTDEEIQKVLPIAMRILDNVITLNFFPMKESEITAKKYRSVGLGFLGLSEYLATNKMMYESAEAREHIDKLFEKYAYQTLKTSNEMAVERGQYQLFEGSEWSKGIIMGKDEQWFTDNSEMADEWKELIGNIKKDGVRFAYHLSPAPNTSTSLVVGTTAGLLPIYKKYFVETNSIAPSVNVAPNLTPENQRYYKEYVNTNMTGVIDMISTIQKWIDQAISFERIIDPHKVTPKEMFEYYVKAWKQGIKTVYYVRSMSLDVKECTSCSG